VTLWEALFRATLFFLDRLAIGLQKDTALGR
jgi:hypothetical protein